MEDEEENASRIININYSHELPQVEDISIIISLNHEIKAKNCLLKYKTSTAISKFFQKIKEYKGEINIQDIIDWYYNLDGPTKTVITSFNSPELIKLLCHEIIKLKLLPKESKDELIIKSQNNNNDIFNELCSQEVYDNEKNEEDLDLLNNSDYLKEEENDVETTKETENIEEQYINKKKSNEEDFLNNTKICSLKDDADTLIFTIESNKLKQYLNYFSEGDSKIKPIIPKLINNEWHITLPNWTNLLEALSFCQIVSFTFILLHFEYYSIYLETYEMPFCNKLKEFFLENEFIINELLRNNVDVANDIFNKYNSVFLAKKSSDNYIKKYFGKDQEFKSDELFNFNKYIFKDLKDNFSESNTNEEKLKILFEKISFYSLNDLIDSKHFFYSEFRNFLLKYKMY